MDTLLEILRDSAWEGIAALLAIFALAVQLLAKAIKFSKKITLIILAGTFLTTFLWFIWPIIHFDGNDTTTVSQNYTSDRKDEELLQPKTSERKNEVETRNFEVSQPKTSIYVAHLTFMDADTKTSVLDDIAELINEAVIDGMKSSKNANPQLEINHPQHKLANTDADVEKLVNIFWDVNLSKREKIQQIITEMMEPNQIDVIVTGQYLEKKGDLIDVRPFVVSKIKKSIYARNYLFDKKQFLCTDPQNPSVKLLCQGTHEKIRDSMKELFEVSQPKTSHYVTNLTFMDADTKTMMAQTDVAALINKAVVDGMQLAKNANSQLKINHPGHQLENTDVNVEKLVNIFWDINLSKGEKIQKIITEMMEPHKIEVIVSGQYLEKKGNSIQVRPFVVSRGKKSIVSRNHIFDKKQFLCIAPQNPSVKILCQEAHEKIRDSVRGLLETL